MTKLERFINKHDLQIELVIDKTGATVYIGKRVDIRLFAYNSKLLDDAIDKAIKDYSGRFLK